MRDIYLSGRVLMKARESVMAHSAQFENNSFNVIFMTVHIINGTGRWCNSLSTTGISNRVIPYLTSPSLPPLYAISL